MMWIDDDAALNALIDEAVLSDRYALDTEFLHDDVRTLVQGHGTKRTAQPQGDVFVQGAGDDATDVVGFENAGRELHSEPLFVGALDRANG